MNTDEFNLAEAIDLTKKAFETAKSGREKDFEGWFLSFDLSKTENNNLLFTSYLSNPNHKNILTFNILTEYVFRYKIIDMNVAQLMAQVIALSKKAHCVSTHCERRQECCGPNDCLSSNPYPKPN